MHLAAGRSKKTAKITYFWLKIAHIHRIKIPNLGRQGCLWREITRENGIRQEIPKEKTGQPGDFACRREITGDPRRSIFWPLPPGDLPVAAGRFRKKKPVSREILPAAGR
jgi:hypothetical protein